MIHPPDPLATLPSAERLHYAVGELLGSDDFRAEQTYHRGRLARALAYLHGSGTVAGLRVTCSGGREVGPDGVERDGVQLQVGAGIALDRLGRIIEIPRPASVRLRWWYEYFADPARKAGDTPEGYTPSSLHASWRAAADGRPDGVVMDLFVAFAICERGITPAFASGPFDALDATQPARLREGYQLDLLLRPSTLPVPFDPWADVSSATTIEQLKGLILDSWTRITPQLGLRSEDTPPPLNLDSEAAEHEYEPHQDKTSVFLARISIPAAQGAGDVDAPVPNWSPAAWPSANSNVNNLLRNFIVPQAALKPPQT